MTRVKRFLIYYILFVFTSCSTNTSEYESQISILQQKNTNLESTTVSLTNQLEKRDQEIIQLQSTVVALNEQQTTLNSRNNTLQQQLDDIRKETILTESDVTVVVIDKINYPVNLNIGRYSPFVSFTFEVTNNTDKEIRGIQGIQTIKDMFGAEIKTMKLDFTDTPIPAQSSVTIEDLGFEVNQFINEDTKIYFAEIENLQFEYETITILFTDGTSKKTIDGLGNDDT
jgi:hypothetical protein